MAGLQLGPVNSEEIRASWGQAGWMLGWGRDAEGGSVRDAEGDDGIWQVRGGGGMHSAGYGAGNMAGRKEWEDWLKDGHSI